MSSSRNEHPSTARRFGQLSDQVETLARQLDETARTEHPAVARRFDQLTETVEALTRQIDEISHNEHPVVARRFQQLSDQVQTLTRQIEEASRIEHPVVARRFEELAQTVEALSRQIDDTSRHEHPAVARRFDQLTKTVETLTRQIDEASHNEHPAVARRFEQLAQTVGALSHQIDETTRNEHPAVARRFNQLTELVGMLSRQIHEASHNEHPAAARRFDQLGETVGSLARQIEETSRSEHPAVARRFDQLTETVGTLSRQIDEASRNEHPAVARRFDQLGETVGSLARQIDETSRSEHPAVARRFGQLSGQVENLSHQIEEVSRTEHPVVARRFDQLGDSMGTLSRQVSAVQSDIGQNSDRQERIVREVEGLREEIEGLSRTLGDLAPRASTTSIETALRDLAERIDAQRDRGVVDAALAPAERIAGELRAVMKDLDPAPLVRNLHADVHAIARRLEEIRTPSDADATALSQLGRQTAEIKELLSALASRPLPLEKLETRLFDLTQRVDGLSTIAAATGSGKEIGEVVKAIRSIVATETGSGFQTFNHRLEHLSGKLDEVLSKSGAKRFDDLDARIDNMHKSLAQRIDRGVAAQQPANTGPLENLVASLAKKIDSALDAKAHNPAFDELGRKIEKLEARFHDPAAAQSIARIESLLASPGHEGHFKELAQRIDNIGKTLIGRFEQDGFAQSGVDLGHIEDLVRRLGDRIDATLEPGAGRRDIEQLEHQVEQLSRKLDRLGDYPSSAKIEELLTQPVPQLQLNEISDRIDFMHNALAARIEEGARSRNEINKTQLTDLVEQLSRNMNSALDPAADPSVLNSLESQIKQLSQRLDRTDGNGAALASIESKIADLFARIDDTRAEATDAAEAAVRRATLDVLRQAASMPGAFNPAVKKEIDDIRRIQDESGARTHETLSAVHETLERVVDRLAVFEDELTEIRSTPPVRNVAQADAERKIESRPTAPEPARQATRPRIMEPVLDALDKQPAAPQARRSREIDDLDLGALGHAAPQVARNETTQSAFIAAARRAAQQVAAQADAEEAARKVKRQSPREVAKEGSAALANVGSTIMARKRPILLGLTALVMIVGAYQMAHYVNLSGGVPKHEETGDARPIGEPQGATEQLAMPQADNTPTQPDSAPAPQKSGLSPIAPLPKLAAPKQAAPAGGAGVPNATQSPTLGLQPIGPAGGGPTMAPHAPGKSATGEQVDNMPVGAIGRSPQETAAAIKALAAGGDATAQYELGARYADGRGVARDNKTAAQWFEKAAEQGLAPAQYRLGSYYEKGIGVDRDYARARKLYQQAAEAGNARAMHNLAVLAAEGNDGKPDYGLASDWFRKAAEFGVRDSQYNLAILYARGLGVGQSMTQSYLWFAVAADQGDTDAAKKRDEVGARLELQGTGGRQGAGRWLQAAPA